MKRQILPAALLAAVAALGFVCCAGADETIRAYYVQEGLDGTPDTSLKSDENMVSPVGKFLTSGSSATFTATPPQGYKVDCWLWKAGPTLSTSDMSEIPGVGESLTCIRTYSSEGQHTLCVSFVRNTYSVTLNRQSGSGGSSSVTATYGAAMPSASMPTRTGYMFGGYFTKTNGSGTKYYNADGSSARNWDKVEAATLYAKWTAKEYVLTVDPNGGSFMESTAPTNLIPNMKFGTKNWNALTGASRTGYTLAGFYTAANGGTQVWDASGKAIQGDYWTESQANSGTWKYDAPDGKFTAYAQWTANTYAVTLDRQGATTGTTSVTATYGAAMPSITPPTRTGYAFDGYYAGTNGGGTKYYNADGLSARTWNIASATNLYAKWTAKEYVLTVDPNGGSFMESTAPTNLIPNMKFGTKNWNALTGASRTGYTLVGFYTAANGGTQVWDASGKAIQGDYWTESQANSGTWKYDAPDGKFTAYAQWTANTYAVTLDSQGGSGGSPSVTATYGAAMPSVTPPTRTGYAFGGYFTETNGGGTQYYNADGTSSTNCYLTAATTLYAKWTAFAYTIAFDRGSDDAVGLMDPVPADYGAEIALPSNAFTYAGWRFQQWESGTNTFADGAIVSNLTQTAGATVTLTAAWEVVVYTFEFAANGGSGTGPANTNMTYNEMLVMPAQTYDDRENYNFLGWSLDRNAAVADYEAGDEVYVSNIVERAESLGVMENDTNTLYAVWQLQPSDASAVLDCNNLYFVAGAKWVVTNDYHKGGSSMCQTTSQTITGGELTAVITNDTDSVRTGTLSFWWAGSFEKSGLQYQKAKLSFLYGEVMNSYEAVANMVSDGHVQNWSNVVQAIMIPPGGSVEISFKNGTETTIDRTVWLDDVSWTWDGEGDVPGPEDAREISGISFDGGVLSLTFTNADARFSYNLHGTNELVQPLSAWPVLWTTNGTGEITITPPVDPAQTKFFYYLETTSK